MPEAHLPEDTLDPTALADEPVREATAEERSAEEAQARRLAERYRLEFQDMNHFRIDQELFRSIPADLMLRYGFVPYRRDGRSLGQMARDELGPIGGAVALIGVMAIMIILIAVLGLVIARNGGHSLNYELVLAVQRALGLERRVAGAAVVSLEAARLGMARSVVAIGPAGLWRSGMPVRTQRMFYAAMLMGQLLRPPADGVLRTGQGRVAALGVAAIAVLCEKRTYFGFEIIRGSCGNLRRGRLADRHQRNQCQPENTHARETHIHGRSFSLRRTVELDSATWRC